MSVAVDAMSRRRQGTDPGRGPHVSRRRETAAQQVVKGLMRLIAAGVYGPGERLREQELADRFGVSRGPIREALRILATRAVVRIEPMIGATVARVSDGEVLEAVQMSAVIFGLAAARAAERGKTDQIELLESKVQQLEASAATDISPRRFFQETELAGLIVLEAADAVRIRRYLMDVRLGAPSIYGPLGFTTVDLRKGAARTWRALLGALRAGDVDEARRLAIKTHDDVLTAVRQLEK